DCCIGSENHAKRRCICEVKDRCNNIVCISRADLSPSSPSISRSLASLSKSPHTTYSSHNKCCVAMGNTSIVACECRKPVFPIEGGKRESEERPRIGESHTPR